MALYQSYLGQQQHITIDVDVGQEILLGIDQAIPCGLIINELVSNALKHAFGARDEGRVSVRFELLGKHSHRLVVTDDGSGLPEGIDMATTESLGLKLVSVLVGQLRGEVTIERQGGTRFQIDFGAGSLAAGVDARAETDA